MFNCIIDSDGLLDLTYPDLDSKIDVARLFFNDNLIKADIRTPNGEPVTGFSRRKFQHIISSSSTRHSPSGLHDVELCEPRARALPLLPKVISGGIDATSYSRWDGRRGCRVVALVTRHRSLGYYFVILGEHDGGYEILTAYVSTVEDYRTSWIHGRGVSIAPWGHRTALAA